MIVSFPLTLVGVRPLPNRHEELTNLFINDLLYVYCFIEQQHYNNTICTIYPLKYSGII